MNWKILLACVVAVFAGTGDFIEHSVWANGTARAPFVYAKFDSVASRLADTLIHDSLNARLPVNIPIAGTNASGVIIPSRYLLVDTAHTSLLQGPGATNSTAGAYSVIEGRYNTSKGPNNHVEGYHNTDTSTSGYAHIEGQINSVNCNTCHVEGENIRAISTLSHDEGYSNYDSSGTVTHVEGQTNTVKSAFVTHVEGESNVVGASYSHVEGYYNVVTPIATYSHTEGPYNYTKGTACHTEGQSDSCKGNLSTVHGYGNVSHYQQAVFGRFAANDNISDSLPTLGQKILKVGWGVNGGALKDVFSVSDSGYISSASLRGAGSRYLVADSSGKLSTTTGTGDTVDGSYTAIIIDSTHGVALSDSIEKTVITMTLAAGDWDVSAVATVSGAMSPYLNSLGASISTTNNAMATNGTEVYSIVGGGSLIPGKYGRVSASIPPIKFRSTSPQTVYLVAYAVWVGGTGVTAYGRISARRWN
jgi:hypothetical protein